MKLRPLPAEETEGVMYYDPAATGERIQNLRKDREVTQEQLAICVLQHTPLDRLGQIVAVSVTALLVIAEIDAALLCAFNLCYRIALCCWIACGIRRKCYCRHHRQHH